MDEVRKGSWKRVGEGGKEPSVAGFTHVKSPWMVTQVMVEMKIVNCVPVSLGMREA